MIGWIVALLFAIACVVLLWRADRIVKQHEAYEDEVSDFYEALQRRLMDSYKTITAIDRRGSFEADDEIGQAYKIVRKVIIDINKYAGNDAVVSAEVKAVIDKHEKLSPDRRVGATIGKV